MSTVTSLRPPGPPTAWQRNYPHAAQTAGRRPPFGSAQNRNWSGTAVQSVRQTVEGLVLDTPVWWGICRLYNGGRFKHHAPFIERRRDGLCLRTGDFLRSQGWAIDEELWAIDGTDCSPCDDKVPDSH